MICYVHDNAEHERLVCPSQTCGIEFCYQFKEQHNKNCNNKNFEAAKVKRYGVEIIPKKKK